MWSSTVSVHENLTLKEFDFYEVVVRCGWIVEVHGLVVGVGCAFGFGLSMGFPV